jgi:hypothetical protein
VSKQHSQTGEYICRHNLGHRRKRAQVRGTHPLGSIEGWISENSIRMRVGKGNSQTRVHKETNEGSKRNE